MIISINKKVFVATLTIEPDIALPPPLRSTRVERTIVDDGRQVEVCLSFLSHGRLNLLDATMRSTLKHLQRSEPDVCCVFFFTLDLPEDADGEWPRFQRLSGAA